MNQKKTIKYCINLSLLLSLLSTINIVHAAATDFIDHGSYTTDSLSGLDWLDVTFSVFQSYDYVSSQFGNGGEYEGWRYATRTEFRQLISNFTDTDIYRYDNQQLKHHEEAIDGLIIFFGSTLDVDYMQRYNMTYDQSEGRPEGEALDYTFGRLVDEMGVHFPYTQMAMIYDSDSFRNSPDWTQTIYAYDYKSLPSTDSGSFLVRDVPEPATFWLAGICLLFFGFLHNRDIRRCIVSPRYT